MRLEPGSGGLGESDYHCQQLDEELKEDWNIQEHSIIVCAVLVGITWRLVQTLLGQQIFEVIEGVLFVYGQMSDMPLRITVYFHCGLHSMYRTGSRHVFPYV